MKHLAVFLLALVCTQAKADYDDERSPLRNALDATVKVQNVLGETFCSGTIIRGTRLVLSAWHCFDGREDFQLEGVHGVYGADIVAKDETNDTVLLRPYGVNIRRRDGVRLARHAPRMGDVVFALGHANGDGLPYSFTAGVVSFAHRKEPQHYMQSTAVLVGGMSGGGTYDRHGHLVGANLFEWETLSCDFLACRKTKTGLYGHSHLSVVRALLDSV